MLAETADKAPLSFDWAWELSQKTAYNFEIQALIAFFYLRKIFPICLIFPDD